MGSRATFLNKVEFQATNIEMAAMSLFFNLGTQRVFFSYLFEHPQTLNNKYPPNFYNCFVLFTL